MSETVRNHAVIDRYKEIVRRLSCAPENEIINGSFSEKADVVQEAKLGVRPNKRQNKTHTENSKEKPTPSSKDISDLLRNHVQKNDGN